MQADAEGWHCTSAADGIRSGRARDHQAGGRQDAPAMRLLDGFVDLDGQTEIVRRDDVTTQV
jgi:hypothetical protein